MPLVEYLNYEVLDDRGSELKGHDLFENAAAADLDVENHGFFGVEESEYILTAAEAAGPDWPFSCWNGICSICAAILLEGSVEIDSNQALNEEEVAEENVRLTCINRPTSDHLRLIYDAKQLEYLRNRVVYLAVLDSSGSTAATANTGIPPADCMETAVYRSHASLRMPLTQIHHSPE